MLTGGIGFIRGIQEMKIVDVRETWIHTHFLVDSWDILPEERFEIDMRVEPELKRLGIQYALHYERKPQSQGYTIVLECIPFPKTRDYIKNLIDGAIKEFPIRRKDEQRNVITKITVQEEGTKEQILSGKAEGEVRNTSQLRRP
jgi:hypothetical protein